MSFASLGLSAPLVKALADENYQAPYPIQREVIPAILAQKDVLGIAQTGSGKTASFVLPLLMKFQGKFLKNRHIKALVLVPTRELAVQVGEVFELFSSALPKPLKTMAVHGGVSINPQMIGMQGVSILVATPGRLLELVDSGALSLSDVRTLVLDEADKMLNMGFQEEMDKILSLLPKVRQNLLFSATLNEDISSIREVLLKDPMIINTSPPSLALDLIQQTIYYISEERKGPLLRYIIQHNNLEQVLVFTSSTRKADQVMNKLRKNGIDARAIHSKKSQGARTEALKMFKIKQLRVLVATDLLSRGIDIEFLPYVINYELPRSPKDFVHRIGRTGRAESPGEAITFVTPDDEHHLKVIQKKMGTWPNRVDGDAINLQGF